MCTFFVALYNLSSDFPFFCKFFHHFPSALITALETIKDDGSASTTTKAEITECAARLTVLKDITNTQITSIKVFILSFRWEGFRPVTFFKLNRVTEL